MPQVKRNPSVVIIGAGMTGMLMVIKLREAGITDIVVLEKNTTPPPSGKASTLMLSHPFKIIIKRRFEDMP